MNSARLTSLLWSALRIAILSAVFIDGFVAVEARAGNPDAVTGTFYEQTAIVDKLVPYTDRISYSRLVVIRRSITTVISDMEANVAAQRPEITLTTLRLIQNLIVQYRFSKVFLGWTTPPDMVSIWTEETASLLNDLQAKSQKLVTDYGIDDSPYTKITADTFSQMKRLMDGVLKLPTDNRLKQGLTQLIPMMGEVIASGQSGDQRLSLEKGRALTLKLRELYPLFDQISRTDAAFGAVIEIQGLNEFYAEFDQVDIDQK